MQEKNKKIAKLVEIKKKNQQTWLLELTVTEKTRLKNGAIKLLPVGSHPKVRKELKKKAKDKSSVKALECVLHKPADWSDRILEA